MRRIKIISAFTDQTLSKNLQEFINDDTKEIFDKQYSTALTKDGKILYSVLVEYKSIEEGFTENPKRIFE